MTQAAQEPVAVRMSPRAIREATFSTRRRGCDPDEVHEFLHTLAGQVEAGDRENARVRAELERVRAQLAEEENQEGEINTRAVALFSQAQQVADRLVAEAVEHARELMDSARAQQREILERAQEDAHAATQQAGMVAETAHSYPGASAEEVEYVRTFAHVAQVQLRSILDALTEQVDRLAEGQSTEVEPQAHAISGQLMWQTNVRRQPRDGW